MRLLLCAGIWVVLFGCRQQCEPGAPDRCEGEELVECTISGRSGHTSWARTNCGPNQCFVSDGNGFCAAESTVCDPKTFQASLVGDKQAIICESRQVPQHHPTKLTLDCKANENSNKNLVVNGGKAGCVMESTPCDPATFEAKCMPTSNGKSDDILSCSELTIGANEEDTRPDVFYPTVTSCPLGPCAVNAQGKAECTQQ